MKTLTALTFLLVISCGDLVEPEPVYRIQPTAVTDAAAVQALQCGIAHGLHVRRSYASLELYVRQAESYIMNGWSVAAYAEGNRVTALAPYQHLIPVWAHDFLHVFFNLPGTSPETHPAIFTDCGLMLTLSQGARP